MARELPSGTVTLLFTDIVGSTRLLQELGRERYVRALTGHRGLLREAFSGHGGVEVEMQGDSFHFSFPFARDAVAAAAAGQRALAGYEWEAEPIHVRIGLHTGEPMQAEGLYAGLDVHRAARVMSAAHGGQILVSERTADLVEGELPEGVALRDLGEHRLKDLSLPQRLYDLVVDGLENEFPPPKTLENRPTNLPVQPTPLVGRERELEELRELLNRDSVRLVTLTGPGGTGKTRLALHAAADLVEQFRDGVYVVFLSSLREPSLLMPTVSRTLGVREQPGEEPLDRLATHLRERQLLLVADNAEHLADAAHELGQLVSRCQELKILVSSRAPLHLAGEREYPVPPLAVPAGWPDHGVVGVLRYEGVRLFVQQAQAVKPDFQLTNENAAAVAQICVRLDGLPLALELAAARIRMLSPQALLNRLDRALELLSGGPVDAEERHRTLRATVAWSYELLSEQERALFARLAVFAGGCRVEAAERVCNPGRELGLDTLDALGSLLEKSLIRQRDDPDGEPRFWMLETIREYAHEQLEASGEADELRRSNDDWYRALARTAYEELMAAGEPLWLTRLEQEHANLRAALARTRETAPQVFVELTGWLWRFWWHRGHLREGEAWLDAALCLADGLSDVRARLLLGAAYIAQKRGDFSKVVERAEECLSAARQLDDSSAIVRSLGMLASAAAAAGDYARAIDLGSEAVKVGRADKRAATLLRTALHNHAMVLESSGDTRRAGSAYEEALELARSQQATMQIPLAFMGLGGVALAENRLGDARSHYVDALRLGSEAGDITNIPNALAMLGAIAASEREWRRATLLLAAAEQAAEQSGRALEPSQAPYAIRARTALREQYGEEELASAWAEGRALSVDEAITLALTSKSSTG